MFKPILITVPESMAAFIKVAAGKVRASGQSSSSSAFVVTYILEAMEDRLESQPWIASHLTRVRDELQAKRRRSQPK